MRGRDREKERKRGTKRKEGLRRVEERNNGNETTGEWGGEEVMERKAPYIFNHALRYLW